MKLNILNINNYIQQNKLKPVTSTNIYTGGKNNKIDSEGVFSESIFGKLGSKERRTTFGYIDLNFKFIHPEAYSIIIGIHPIVNKIILKKNKYTIADDGTILEDKNGHNGILFLIANFEKINFSKLDGYREKNLKYVLNNLEKVFVDKWLVLPAGIRDIQISKKTGDANIQYSEISELYQYLIRQTSGINISDIDELGESAYDIYDTIIEKSQHILNNINVWIKDKLKGKFGLIRSGLMKKVVDYSSRLVMSCGPHLKMGYCGLPWHVVLKLYEPFTIHELLKKETHIADLIKAEMEYENMDIETIKTFLHSINLEPESITGELKSELFKLAEKIIENKVITYKRDPSENKDSWISSYVNVEDTGFVIKVNPYDLGKNTGDFDGDAASIYAVLTEEAQKQAKESMNPRHSKSCWYGGVNTNKPIYGLSLDAMCAIYSATKR